MFVHITGLIKGRKGRTNFLNMLNFATKNMKMFLSMLYYADCPLNTV